MYKALVYFEPLKMDGSALKVAFITLGPLPTSIAPRAPPPIMITSTGCQSEARWPPAMAKPPKIDARMTT